MPLAARITDMHLCPQVTGTTPHVGGTILGPGVANVLIGSQVAAVVGDTASCVGPPDTIANGSGTVFIGGKPAARVGDSTVHGGKISIGFTTVIIGG